MLLALLPIVVAGCGGGGSGSTPDNAALVPTAKAHTSSSSVNAANCSATAVQSAVNSASVGGDVNIPAGDCNWGMQQVNVPGGITLSGAGKDLTIIRRTGTIADHLIKFDCSGGKSAGLSDMTLSGNGNMNVEDNGLGLLNGCVDFKVSNARFTKFGGTGIEVHGTLAQRGVITKSDFIDNHRIGAGYGISVIGDGSWPGAELGSQNAVFVEDSNFSGNTTSITGNNSARYVFRYNKVVATDKTKDYAMTKVRGKNATEHGARSWEFYHNAFSTNLTSGMARTAIAIEGGDGVAFNNTMTASIARPFELDVAGFSCGTYPGPDQIRAANFWNNTANTYPNGIDNNCPSSIGAGRDVFTTAKAGYAAFTYPHPLTVYVPPTTTTTAAPTTTTTVPSTTTTTVASCNFPNWAWSTQYAAGAIVRFPDNGKFYRAKYANPGWDPVISTYFWEPYTCAAATTTTTAVATTTTMATPTTTTIAACNFADWKWSTQYAAGAIVRFPDNGKFYRAKFANPGWDPVISTYFWEPYTCTGSSATTTTQATTTTTASTSTTTLSGATGPIINASSCAYGAVQSAVNSAGNGTTVKIPAGDCNWGTSQLNVPGGVYIQGAGQDVTTIRRVGTVSESAYLFAFNCSNGRRAIFSGATLVGNGNGAIWDKGLGLLNGCQDFKVSNTKFTKFTFSALYVGDAANQRGIIFGNNFIDNYSASLRNLGYGVVVYGGGAWPALSLGSQNAVFVEDNYFSGNRHNIASNNGSVYVFRYNTVVGQDPAKDYAMTDAHGISSSPRGSRSYEVYNNKYSTNINGGLQRTAIGIRGGDGVIFNNSVVSTISRAIELMPEGYSCGTYPGKDQIRSLYIWNNTTTDVGYTSGGIANGCPSSIGLNRDYFLAQKPGYTPYAYPHPGRGS